MGLNLSWLHIDITWNFADHDAWVFPVGIELIGSGMLPGWNFLSSVGDYTVSEG